MIVDHISRIGTYRGISEKIEKALEYLASGAADKLETGKYNIEDEDIIAIVNEYETKDITEESLAESHIDYIDIHYMVSGEEMLGYAYLSNQVPKIPYDVDGDCVMYDCDISGITLTPGMFAICYPHDIHIPGLNVEGVSNVRKIVMKIIVE